MTITNEQAIILRDLGLKSGSTYAWYSRNTNPENCFLDLNKSKEIEIRNAYTAGELIEMLLTIKQSVNITKDNFGNYKYVGLTRITAEHTKLATLLGAILIYYIKEDKSRILELNKIHGEL